MVDYQLIYGQRQHHTLFTLSTVQGLTYHSFDAWYNKRRDLSHLRPFGSIAYVHIPKPERKKLDQKSMRCIFVGYIQTQKAYCFWNPVTRTVKISRDATFDEHHRNTG